MKKKVAIQGIAGSYHDIAARNDGDRKYDCRQLVAEP